MDLFFIEWDLLENLHPWGINYLAPVLLVHDVPFDVCEEIDSLLYMDLMTQVKCSEKIFWVYVVLNPPFAEISLQQLPSSPFLRSVRVVASPSSIIASILACHRWIVGSTARCFPSRVQGGRHHSQIHRVQ